VLPTGVSVNVSELAQISFSGSADFTRAISSSAYLPGNYKRKRSTAEKAAKKQAKEEDRLAGNVEKNKKKKTSKGKESDPFIAAGKVQRAFRSQCETLRASISSLDILMTRKSREIALLRGLFEVKRGHRPTSRTFDAARSISGITEGLISMPGAISIPNSASGASKPTREKVVAGKVGSDIDIRVEYLACRVISTKVSGGLLGRNFSMLKVFAIAKVTNGGRSAFSIS